MATLKEKVEAEIDKTPRLIQFMKSQGINITGKGYAECPWHDDADPSLSVNPETDEWKCFSCGRHGRFISFYAEFNKIRYTQAIKRLAKELGLREDKTIEIKEIGPKQLIKYDENIKRRRKAITLRVKKQKGDYIDNIIELLCNVQEPEDGISLKEIVTSMEDRVDVSDLFNIDINDL